MDEAGAVGRADLLADVGELLADGKCVALRGPSGSGKSTVLRALGGALVVAVPSGGAHAVTADLLSVLPGHHLACLPGPQRRAADIVLRRESGEIDPVALRFALAAVLTGWRAEGGGPVAIDDAQWMDPDSAYAISFAQRRAGVGLVAAAGTEPVRLFSWVPVPVPPLTVDGVAELLENCGLPSRLAVAVHRASGGVPAWSVEIGKGMAAGNPLPDTARQLISERLARLPAGTRRTLLLAALARQPTASILRRAGRPGADVDLRSAEDAGLLTAGRFAGTAISETLIREATWAERAPGHRALATAVTDPVDQIRHRALASDDINEELAASLACAAQTARSAGDRAYAAELGMLAVERGTDAHVSWIVAAADDAAAAGRADLARDAEALLERVGTPAERVRARLAIIAAMGQAVEGLGETFARALADAEGDPGLEAEVRLRIAVRANVTEGDPSRARTEAIRAAELAVLGNDASMRAAALAMRARVERILGDPAAESTLATALAMRPVLPDAVNASPRFLEARHALFDDQLNEAHEMLLGLLPVAERSGAAEDHIDVLRSLAEVEARMGRCATALTHAAQALDLTEAAGLSPGPAWFTAALAEAAGGSFERARTYAAHGARASEEEHDLVYLSRNLHVLGFVRLLEADSDGAVAALTRVGELEAAVADPSIVRWHGDLIAAFAGTGDLARGRVVLEDVWPTALRLGRVGVVASLERAKGMLLSAEGSLDEAASLLQASADQFGSLGLVLEKGRTLLAFAQVARRRRHRSEERAVLAAASSLFAAAGARPWVRLATDAVDRMEASAGGPELTDTEARVAELVAGGASNREVASALFLSVKTVEAALTRIYRKLGVRSRTQLAASLRTGPD